MEDRSFSYSSMKLFKHTSSLFPWRTDASSLKQSPASSAFSLSLDEPDCWSFLFHLSLPIPLFRYLTHLRMPSANCASILVFLFISQVKTNESERDGERERDRVSIFHILLSLPPS